MSLLTGYPKVVVSVQDRSIIKDTPVGGIIAVQGITRRGRAGTAYFVGSELSFIRLLGNQFPDDDDRFPFYCLRMLQAGAKLWVVPVHHYTTITNASSVEGTKATVTIGTTNTSSWRAEEVGQGYNGTEIEIVAAASGNANFFDVNITLTDSDRTITLTEVAENPDAAGITAINERLLALNAGVELTAVAGTGMKAGTGSLASGARVIADVAGADFNGDAGAQNGWYAFDKITDAFRIANIGIEDPAVDEGLRAYTLLRGDMRYHIATPLGLTASGFEDYRDGTGAYSHTKHDTYFGSLVAADISVTDTRNTAKKFDIPGLVDVLALQSRKDTQFGPWYSAAGPKRGKIVGPNNGISSNSVNLGAGSQQADYDRIYQKGVNAVIDDAQFGPVYWGNKSLKVDRTSLLNRENVADLIVYITRTLKPIVRLVMFEPTVPKTFKELYRRVRPVIQDLEQRNAIVPGEGTNWFWQGDQNVDDRQNVVVNNVSDLDAGIMKARFLFIPISATEFIGIEVTPTDSESVSFVVQERVTI